MSVQATEYPSYRELVLRHLASLFTAMEIGQPETIDGYGNPNAYEFTFSTVVRHPLSERERRTRYALAVVDGRENKIENIAFMTNQFDVALDFSALLDTNESPSEVLNMMLTNMQRKIREDITLGGLVDRVAELGNDLDIEFWEERSVSGTLFIQIQYRHAEADPRRRL